MPEDSGSESWKRSTPGSNGLIVSRHATPDEEQTALRLFSTALILSALVLAVVLYALTNCSSGTMRICKESAQSGEGKAETPREASAPEAKKDQSAH